MDKITILERVDSNGMERFKLYESYKKEGIIILINEIINLKNTVNELSEKLQSLTVISCSRCGKVVNRNEASFYENGKFAFCHDCMDFDI